MSIIWRQVLLFGVKYKLMTKELALYTANLTSQMKNFDKHLYDVLVKCYEMYDEAMILTSICTLLIKGSRTCTSNCPSFLSVELFSLKQRNA